ncbi:MAG: hypothetical protein M1416_00305 [Candidatus Pacearchaeota archaeon]|nr:hypothetical protein [Candidatus Pacearchaeota archaeon]
MIEINLRDALNGRQFYVAELSEKFGIEIRAVRHDVATDTCFEKAELLGWPADRIVKAIFVHKDEDFYGFVFPELGKESPRHLDIKETLPKVIDVSKKQAKDFRNSYCPDGMEYGTCTPFVLEDSFSERKIKKLRKIFIHEMNYQESSLADISIGGFGENAHKTSLHIGYSDIYKILKENFGDRIVKTNLFDNI